MQQLWVTYIFVDNSWLHPTMSDLQKHTCTAPPTHGDPQQREWGEEGGLTFSPGRTSMCGLDQNIL